MIRALALAASLAALGCADEEALAEDVVPGGGVGAAGIQVNIVLDDDEITPSPTSASAGSITFSVYNQGSQTHQFVVVKTALAAEDLPTRSDGSFDESGAGAEIEGKLEAVPVGGTFELKVSLEAGAYVLLCNLVIPEGDEQRSHFHEGMHAPFVVQ